MTVVCTQSYKYGITAKMHRPYVKVKYEKIEIRLEQLMQEKGLSKNKLCTMLECKIEDLLIFYPPEKK